MCCLKWSVALACVAVLCSMVDGQDKKGKAALAPFVPVTKSLPAQALAQLKEQTRAIDVVGAQPSGAGVKDLAEVQKMLEDMGFEPQVQDNMGYKYLKVPTASYPVYVDFNAEYGRIWISLGVGKLEDPTKITQAKLFGLLEWSGPFACFQYDSKSQYLQCFTGIESNIVTKAALKRRIDTVASTMANSEQYWRTGQ